MLLLLESVGIWKEKIMVNIRWYHWYKTYTFGDSIKQEERKKLQWRFQYHNGTETVWSDWCDVPIVWKDELYEI